MTATGANTREQIVHAADELFYQQGYERTSFADIAEAVRISRGNFYHHFKTKDAILRAVIHARLANTRRMLDEWEAEGSTPAERIRQFIEMWVTNEAEIMDYGCPVGTLCGELAKLSHPSRDEAKELFSLFRDWLRKQFVLAGHERDADSLALQLLVRSQGVAMLANAFHDRALISDEVRKMSSWLTDLEA